ncbi:hypothetical protein FB645_003292 [Coemansia sp. IMI 203386]|nr:hypothetical protein FB645_003292 [Coemansia sp. IMI 203386]
MLRSKNLKKILEQALTRDVGVCAVFNEDGVVIAHASSPQSNFGGFGKRESTKLASQGGVSSSIESDRYHQSPGSSQYLQQQQRVDSQVQDHTWNSASGYAAKDQPVHSGAWQGTPKYRGSNAESPQRRQNGGYHVSGSTSANNPSIGAFSSQAPQQVASSSGGIRMYDNNPTIDAGSCSSSLNEDDIGGLSSMSMREKLEDDLALAANLWQSYESIPSLIERKEPDVEEDVGDGVSEMQDDMLGNSLNMIIIECDHGKAVVTRLGSYRLFMLCTHDTPLGLLKHKSTNLCRFLEECLHLN